MRMILWALRLCICINLAVFLLACSPQMNWRELVNQKDGYAVSFPDKPVTVTRELALADQTVSLTLQSAKVDEAYFAVGVMPLRSEQLSKVELIADALQESLKNNIKAKRSNSTVKPSFPVWREFQAEGTLPNGAPAIVSARFFIHQGRLIELLAMGDEKKFTPEVLEQWHQGFHFLVASQ
jgi:hypothetical protein